MNSHEKTLLIGENLVAPEQKELLQKLKNELQKLTDSKAAGLRKWPLVEVKENGCWECNGALWEGYKTLTVEGKTVRLHRFFYEKLVGEVQGGLVLDHLCRNRACCNPFHLEQVTDKENILRGKGIAAQNSIKTHCKRGHEFTPENTYIKNGRLGGRVGGRTCRACSKVRGAKRREKRRRELKNE